MKLKAISKAVAMAVVAAVPASGQAAQKGTAKPDFSGVWAHPWLPGFEALEIGRAHV